MQLILDMHPIPLLLLGLAICWAQDIVCKKGRLSKRISVGKGDSLTFKTQAGGTYEPNTKCHVIYKKEASCPKMRFYCSVFKINNKRQNCKGKDKMKIQISRTKTAYCGGTGPDVTTSADYLKVAFISDKRNQSSGAVCRVECVETKDALFLVFQTKYNKTYSNQTEKVKQFKNWQQRTNSMKEHNDLFELGKKTYRKSENAMFDMTLKEIEANYMGVSLYTDSYTSKDSRMYIDIYKLPSSINWVEKGYVTPVQNQAGCGSSWAHSAAGALEGAYKKDTKRLVKINVDYLINCCNVCKGCKGSYPGVAYIHVMYNGIVMVNETYRSPPSNSYLETKRNLPKDPLHETHGTPKQSLQKVFGFPIKNPLGEIHETHTNESILVNQHIRRSLCLIQNKNVVRIRSISSINHGREDELMQAVAEIGPVSVIICAPLDLVDYAGEDDDVFYEDKCSEGCKRHSQVNHAVLVVGYGEQKNKRTKNIESYWLVKNSWGTDWANEGYIKMARNQDNNCGIASYATYPSVWGHLICGVDLDILLDAAEGKLDIQCCGQEEHITCIIEDCRKACGGKEPIECLKPVEEFTNIENCDNMNHKIAQVKITRGYCKYRAPCPTDDGSYRYCSCCKYSYYYRGYKKCAPMCNDRNKYCTRSAPIIHDEIVSDFICQEGLNEKDVSQDLNLYFSKLTDASTSLRVLCCSNGITTTSTCTGSDCSEVCGGDLTCILMVDTMEYSGHCYEDVLLVLRTEDSCKFAPCPYMRNNTVFCKCCEYPSYNTKCPEMCSSCPQSTVQGCGRTWKQFASYCYKYFRVKLSWYDAQSRCEKDGGHLASIHSEKEHKFLATLSPRDSKVWIGANDLDIEGTFAWTDGTSWNYQNWGADQPDNGMGGEHCGGMGWRGGEMSWNDLPCDDDYKRVFICKKK